jgi:hypothetical protein
LIDTLNVLVLFPLCFRRDNQVCDPARDGFIVLLGAVQSATFMLA